MDISTFLIFSMDELIPDPFSSARNKSNRDLQNQMNREISSNNAMNQFAEDLFYGNQPDYTFETLKTTKNESIMQKVGFDPFGLGTLTEVFSPIKWVVNVAQGKN